MSKRMDKRRGVKRLRLRLNAANCPPSHAGISLVRFNWGSGPLRYHSLDANTPANVHYGADYDPEQDWVEFHGFRTVEDLHRHLNDCDDWKDYAECGPSVNLAA